MEILGKEESNPFGSFKTNQDRLLNAYRIVHRLGKLVFYIFIRPCFLDSVDNIKNGGVDGQHKKIRGKDRRPKNGTGHMCASPMMFLAPSLT